MKILRALIKKEFFQIIRDPSSILISVVFPFILIMLFAFAINLDNNQIRVGVAIDGEKADTTEIISAFQGTKYLNTKIYPDRKSMEADLVHGDIKAMIIFPSDFIRNFKSGNMANVQLISDGTDPNMALFIDSYIKSAMINYQKIYLNQVGMNAKSLINVEPTVWFNPELKSRYFILPSSIAIIMTLVGMILTALVIAREWERGTMEAMLTTQATKMQIILAKYISYYCLALFSTAFCTFLCVYVFGVPFRGSYLVFFITSSLFIWSSLGQGLIISTLSENQFLASITAMVMGFLPAIMLSGFLFEISSMPIIFQYVTYIVPARYFATIINSIFMAGNIWSIIVPQSLFLLITDVVLFIIMYRITKQRLE